MWFQTRDSCEHESPALLKVWGGWRHGPHLYTSSKVRRLCLPYEVRMRSEEELGKALGLPDPDDEGRSPLWLQEGRPSVTGPTRGRLGTNGEEDSTQRRLQPGRDEEEHQHVFAWALHNKRGTSGVTRCPALLYHPLDKIQRVLIARGCMFTELSLPALQIDFQQYLWRTQAKAKAVNGRVQPCVRWLLLSPAGARFGRVFLPPRGCSRAACLPSCHRSGELTLASGSCRLVKRELWYSKPFSQGRLWSKNDAKIVHTLAEL